MSRKVGVVRFLGTNCDQDVFDAVKLVGLEPEWAWYQDEFDKSKFDALILAGGFSYGDYLRCGALAAKAPVMKSVVAASKHGTPVLGICNGFQILCEANLLPGVLVKNSSLRFKDDWVQLKFLSHSKSFGGTGLKSARLPIAHGEGRYYVEDDQTKMLFDNEQVWCVYEKNPNGSVENIAGVLNENKNVAALMPHPERAVKDFMGSTDGLSFFKSIL
jgi:phosphoribosylformylglycinamidine synthase subunit PurQ / glutaminase